MKFAHFPVAQAEGVRLAHSLVLPTRRLRKGHLVTTADVVQLQAAKVTQVLGARLDGDDVDEDAAAASAAAALAGAHLGLQAAAQGRCNLRAALPGVLCVDAAAITRLNGVDAALTLGTLAPYSAVSAGQVVATLKTIPFALAATSLAAWLTELASAAVPPLRLMPYTPLRTALICSRGTATSEALLSATEAVTRQRLTALGSELVRTARCAHDVEALQRELRLALELGAQLILVAGAAVSKDRGDTVPAAISAAGGDIVHFGMPVEPGNMLLLARLAGVPVINLPGCARSPRSNGLDWVLQRLHAGLPLGSAEIMAMGVGGLILSGASARLGAEAEADTEAEAKAKPAAPRPARIAALLLAAGRSQRMGERNKLLCEVDGKALLLHALAAACASRCVQTLLVSGHAAAAVEALAQTQPVSLVRNADYASGMASSLRCGLRALPRDLDGVVVLLADMPRITAAHLDRLIAAFDASAPAIVAPYSHGRRGNPVLWPRQHFAALLELDGDQGARGLLERHAASVTRVDFDDDAIFIDVDTPAALAQIAAP